MRHYGSRRRTSRRRPTGNTVPHVPSTIGGTIASQTSVVVIISSPSIFAAGSASSNIEAQDKDRTVNVGHHIGLLNLGINFRNTTADGIIEFAVYKVERAASTPILGTHPVPSTADINTQGMQQATRLANPGKVFYYDARAYTIEHTFVHKIKVSPAKYKLSKCKAGDHWVLQMYNRGSASVTFDYNGRYKEYE